MAREAGTVTAADARRRRLVAVLGFTVALVVPPAVGALASGPGAPAPPAVALVLVLLVVTIAAVTARYSVALIAALTAALGFDYFETQPFHSLSIRRSVDIETAVLLLIVALVVAEVAVWGRRHRDAARACASAMATVDAVAALLSEGLSGEAAMGLIARELVGILELGDCWFDPAGTAAVNAVLGIDGGVRYGDLAWDAGSMGLPGPTVALQVPGAIGAPARFVLVPVPGRPVLPCARQAAGVLALLAAVAIEGPAR